MEIEIFKWTGFVVWWTICICTVVACIVAPIITYIMSSRKMKSWMIASNLKDSGLTKEDVKWIYHGVHYDAFTKSKPDYDEIWKFIELAMERCRSREMLNRGE